MMMKFDDKNFIAERIKYHRKKLDLTQAELAEMVELSDQHLSRIESGCYVPSLKTFFMLVNTLKIDLREFGFSPENTNNPLRDRLIDGISNANDTELIFYENMMNAVDLSLAKIKRDIL